jgi:hypothetical protein
MSEHDQKHEVKIFIGEHHYHSPTPTTGAALYTLGNVPPGMVLYREVRGDREDPMVPNDPEVIHLTQDEHFHSGPPEFRIIVNGEKKDETVTQLSFDQVVLLAFNPPPSGPEVRFTITYRHGPHANPHGTMTAGQIVQLKNGMIFNVKHTDKS